MPHRPTDRVHRLLDGWPQLLNALSQHPVDIAGVRRQFAVARLDRREVGDDGGFRQTNPDGTEIIENADGTGQFTSVNGDVAVKEMTDDGGFVTGAPHVAGAKVTGVVDGVVQDKKIRVFTKKRRGGMRRTLGHRTQWTRVRITGIETA